MKIIRYILIALILLSFAVAQPMGMMNFPQPQMQDGGMNERMEMMMTWKLTNDLDLTPEQAEKFFPRMKEHRKNMENIEKDIMMVYKEIHQKIESDKNISDNDFNDFINTFQKLETQKIDERIRFYSEMKGILDNTQLTKLVMYKHHFADDLRNQIRRRPNNRS